MRIVILFLAIIALGCNRPTERERMVKEVMVISDSLHKLDSILIGQYRELSNAKDVLIQEQRDSINMLMKSDCGKLQKRCDSLRTALAIQNFRVGRIKYYVNICNRKPSQDKFLRGWINRTLK